MSDLSGSQMAHEVREVAARVRNLATWDVSELTQDEFLDLFHAAGELDRLNGAFMAKMAGDTARRSAPELPGGGMARKQGHGNPGKMIENFTGGSPVGSRRRVEAGEAFDLVPDESAKPAAIATGAAEPPAPKRHKWPHVAAASMAGDLSVDAAAIIVGGLNQLQERVSQSVLDECERRLVEKARTQTVSEVRRTVGAAVARLDAKGTAERQRQQHQERYLSWKQDFQGVVKFSGVLDAVTAAPIITVLEQMVTQGYRSRRDQDPTDPDQRTVGQMRADALFELCRHALGCGEMDRSGVRTSLVVRVDLDEWMRGVGSGRIDGIEQPVAVGELRRLAGDAGIIPEVLGRNGEVLDLGREVRLFTRAQRVALLERDGGCAKCHAPPEHCEAHHIRWWEHGGVSDLSNGVMLCTRCHHDVHRQGWEIHVDGGQVSFVPPAQIDPDRQPRPGGLAALDIGDIPDPEFFPDDWEVTPELVAQVREWERQSRKSGSEDACDTCEPPLVVAADRAASAAIGWRA